MKKPYIILLFAIIGLSANAQTAYITNAGSNIVSVINVATNTVTDSIPVGSGPYGISVSPDGSKVYVANYIGNSVSVIDSATNIVSATIAVGEYPFGVSVSPDGSKVYVTNDGTNTVSLINTATNTVSATIPVGSESIGVSVSPDGNKVYVANSGDNTVSVINTATNTVSDTIKVGKSPVAFGNFISTYGTGIASQSMLSAGIEVYPSPNNGKFQVSSPKYQVSSIVIYNVLGEKVYALPVIDNYSPITIDVSNNSSFPSGVYVVEVKTESGVGVRKFVKE